METYPYEGRRVFDPLSDGISEVELIEWGGSPLSVVDAARISHGKRSTWESVWENPLTGEAIPDSADEETLARVVANDDFVFRQRLRRRDRKLTRYLLDHEHGSPFESSYWEVRVKLPIFVFRHLVRHRHISPNEASGRYIELDEQFYLPVEWRVQAEENHQSSVRDGSKPAEWHREQTKLVNDLYETIYRTYQQLLRNGVAREMARIVLPLGMYTEVVMRGNLRSLMHLMHLRDAEDAQEETRFIARGIYAAVRPVFADTLEIWEEVREENRQKARFWELVEAQPDEGGESWEELWIRAVRE